MFFVLVLLIVVPLQGQAVEGRVVDAVTGEPLQNANVILEGTTLGCLLYTSPSPRDRQKSRMPSSA